MLFAPINPLQITNIQLPSIATQTGFLIPIVVNVTNPDVAQETADIQISTNSTMVFSTSVTLNALQTEIVPCNFNTSVLAIGNYTCTVTVTATNLSAPNTATSAGQLGVTYLGDVNGDFAINFHDITAFVSDYIASYNSGVCNPAIDYNHNGLVNFYDITTFVSSYIASYSFLH